MITNWFTNLFSKPTAQDYIDGAADYMNTAKARYGTKTPVPPAYKPEEVHIATLNITTKTGCGSGSLLTSTYDTSTDIDTVKSTYDDFEKWWHNSTTPSYTFSYGDGKKMILRNDIRTYEIRYKIADV